MAAFVYGFVKGEPSYDEFGREMFPDKYEGRTMTYDRDDINEYQRNVITDYSFDPPSRECDKPRRESFAEHIFDQWHGPKDEKGNPITPYWESGTVDWQFRDKDPRGVTTWLPPLREAVKDAYARADVYRRDFANDGDYHLVSGGARSAEKAVADKDRAFEITKRVLHFDYDHDGVSPVGAPLPTFVATDASKVRISPPYAGIVNVAGTRGHVLYNVRNHGERVDSRMSKSLYSANRLNRVDKTRKSRVDAVTKTNTNSYKINVARNLQSLNMFSKVAKGLPLDYGAEPRATKLVGSERRAENRSGEKVADDILRIMGYTENQIRWAKSQIGKNVAAAKISGDNLKVVHQAEDLYSRSYRENVATYNRLVMQKMDPRNTDKMLASDVRTVRAISGLTKSVNTKTGKVQIEDFKTTARLGRQTKGDNVEHLDAAKFTTQLIHDDVDKDTRDVAEKRKAVNYTRGKIATVQANQRRVVDTTDKFEGLKSTTRGHNQRESIITTENIEHQTEFGDSYGMARHARGKNNIRPDVATISHSVEDEMIGSVRK